MVHFTIKIFIVILVVMWDHTRQTATAVLELRVITLFLLFIFYKAWWWIN